MGTKKHLVTLTSGGSSYKLCRVIYASDGSFMVVSPYHAAGPATLCIATMNYARSETTIPLSETIDLASSEDDGQRLKLSHHIGGFVHFSGSGIVSGKDKRTGAIKGIGIQSWPLTNPIDGPAFGISLDGIECFKKAEGPQRGDVCEIHLQDHPCFAGPSTVMLEGHYFVEEYRRFVRRSDDDKTWFMDIVHPSKAMLRLRVLLPPDDCALQGFIGVSAWSERRCPSNPPLGFRLSGSSGNMRRNEAGEMLGDGIFCVFPGNDSGRSLDYRTDMEGEQS